MDPTDLIPERRAKSWKREHEERCRRHQNNSDLKKCRDPGYGSEQSLLLEIKDNSAEFVKDAAGVEKKNMSASDKLNGSDTDDVENNDTFTFSSAIEDSVIECESTNKIYVESNLINSLESTDKILCDGSRNEVVFPFIKSTEGSDFKTENNLLFKQCPEKKGRDDFVDINGFHLNPKGDSTNSGHTGGDLSVREIMMEEKNKSPVIFHQFETEAAGNTPEGGTETGSSELHNVKSSLLESSAELPGNPGLKGTELVQLEETLPGMDEIMNVSHDSPEGTQLRSSRVPEGDTTVLTDVKPETLESYIPGCMDIVKDTPLGRLPQGQLGCTDMLQGFPVNFSSCEYNMNNEESVQRADASLFMGGNLGNSEEKGELSVSDMLKLGESSPKEGTLLDSRPFEIVDLLGSSQDLEHINSSSSDLQNRNGASNEHQKGSLENNGQEGGVDAGDFILSSSEITGNFTEKINEEETHGIEQERNLFVELSHDKSSMTPVKLSHDKNSTTPVECVDKADHSGCVLGSATSPSPFQEREQSASEYVEDLDTFREVNTLLTDCCLGNVAVEYKDTKKDQGIKLENLSEELDEENSKHLLNEQTEEMAEDRSGDSEYCIGVDIVPEQTEPSATETASIHPSRPSTEDKVNLLVLMLS
jgi:hypothetical protein